MDTTQLVIRVQNGDEQAVNELYYYCYKQAYPVALMLTKSEQDSYEIMQDSFIRAFSSLDLLKDKSDFLKRLYSFFVNKCREYFIREKNFCFFQNLTMVSDDDAPRFNGTETFLPESGVDYTQTKRLATEMLGDLPADQELLVIARHVMRMSDDELAQALSVERKVIVSSIAEAESKLLNQADLLSSKGVLTEIDASEVVSFTVWMFGRAVSTTAVHQMAPAVKKAALSNSVRTVAADPIDDSNTQPGDDDELRTKVRVKAGDKARKNPEPSADENSDAKKPFQPEAERPPKRTDPVTRPNEESPIDIDDGFTSKAEKTDKPSKHTARIIIIAVAAVVAMILGALAFMAFALPNITGQSNPVSEMISGKKEPEYTPEKLVAKYEEAFNAGDRDGIAKLYLPDQSLKRNVEGGAYEMVQKLSNYVLGEKLTINCKLGDDLKYDGDTATGTVKVTLNLPKVSGQDISLLLKLAGIETEKDKPVTFEKYTDGNWYFKEF